MQRKNIIQVGLAVLAGLNVAAPLVLDAQSIAPDWSWQYHALIGFVVFVIVIGWIIWGQRATINELKSGRPQFTLDERSKLDLQSQEDDELKYSFIFDVFFRNIGTIPAYHWRMKFGSCPDGLPNHFAFQDKEYSSANRIDIGNTVGKQYRGTVKYELHEGKKLPPSLKRFLVYCEIHYSDAEINGKGYKEEFYYSYKFDIGQIGNMSLRQKEELIPHVNKAHVAEGATD
uniref:Uncharacterized protein n=1 Tax=viral metagenome TaxID=1070528 RepID=A0A6M3L1Y4_9ZZZZ